MTTVADLIKYLQTQPQDWLVAYKLHSEQCLLDIHDIEPCIGCLPRSDGWVQNQRPDKPTLEYLLFPGN